MPALCLHEAIRPSSLHPSSLFPSSQLACFAPGGMLLRVNSSLHGFGRSEFSWDVQSLQVLCECFPRGPVGTDRAGCPLTRTHDAAGAEVGRDSGSHGDFGGVLVGAC